jgi:hypothetical protein
MTIEQLQEEVIKLRERIAVLEQRQFWSPTPMMPTPFQPWKPYPPYDITCGGETK